MRHPCKQCSKRPAFYVDARGRLKARKGFDLCRRCTRSVKDRVRAVRLVAHG